MASCDPLDSDIVIPNSSMLTAQLCCIPPKPGLHIGQKAREVIVARGLGFERGKKNDDSAGFLEEVGG